MTKRELLKLRKGSYLVTDSICNYNYILHKTDKEGHVAFVYTLISKSGSVHFHYDLIGDYDEDFDRNVPLKRMDISSSVGGISIHRKGSYDVLSSLHLVSVYDQNSITEALKKFLINHKINMSRYDRKYLRKIHKK